MDIWGAVIGIGAIFLIAVYVSGAKSEKVLNIHWLAQFRDRDSNDIFIRVFSAKELFEGLMEFKTGDFKEASRYFNALGDSAKGILYTASEQRFFNHPAVALPVAPLSFDPGKSSSPPPAVFNCFDLMAMLSGCELITVRRFSSDVSYPEGRRQKLMVYCPFCRSKMNLPLGKRVLVTCPHCQRKFTAKT